MWSVYKAGTKQLKATFDIEPDARTYHRMNGGTLVYEYWWDITCKRPDGNKVFASVLAGTETWALTQILRKYPDCIIEDIRRID